MTSNDDEARTLYLLEDWHAWAGSKEPYRCPVTHVRLGYIRNDRKTVKLLGKLYPVEGKLPTLQGKSAGMIIGSHKGPRYRRLREEHPLPLPLYCTHCKQTHTISQPAYPRRSELRKLLRRLPTDGLARVEIAYTCQATKNGWQPQPLRATALTWLYPEDSDSASKHLTSDPN